MAISRAELSRVTEQQHDRDAVLSGLTDSWPTPDGGELIVINTVSTPVSSITDLPTGARVESALQVELAAKLKLLKIRLPKTAVYPVRPVSTAELDPAQRATARKANQLTLRLRDVQHRNNQLIAAEESRKRAAREQHVLVLRQLLDEAPPKMRARAEAIGDLAARAKRVAQFLEDVAILAGAVAGAEQERQLAEIMTEAAEVLNEPKPQLPQSQLPPDFTLPIKKLAMMMGVAPMAPPVDGKIAHPARAALKALRRAG